jgi:arylformamidase
LQERGKDRLARPSALPHIPLTRREEQPMAIDYEVEYNNRARVPEHPEIFARWTKDAAAYRAEASAEGRAELGLPYGSTPRQTIDLFVPPGGGAAPIALFVHGGYWRSLEPSQFSHVARGLNTHGITVAVAGYDLSPQVPISTIIDEIRQACLYLWRRFGRRLMVCGHSAGGHLAACMIATDWKALAADAPPDLAPAGYAISGVFDLEPLVHVSMNEDFKLDADSARHVSPIRWPAAGRAFDAVVGSLESPEFLRQSRSIADAWRKAGADTRYEELKGLNHFTVLDPLPDPAGPMVGRLVALCERTRS